MAARPLASYQIPVKTCRDGCTLHISAARERGVPEIRASNVPPAAGEEAMADPPAAEHLRHNRGTL